MAPRHTQWRSGSFGEIVRRVFFFHNQAKSSIVIFFRQKPVKFFLSCQCSFSLNYLQNDRRNFMFADLFDYNGFSPHGLCLLWQPELLWSLAGSDALISTSYLSISAAIVLYLIKRQDMYLRWVALAFALFIFLCAASHATDLWTLWVPVYGIQMVVKEATALVSLFTAFALWRYFPYALSLPSAAQMAFVNGELRRENEERRVAEASLLKTTGELQSAIEELDGFAYAVSHDLRAPLRAMIGFSEALSEDFGDRLEDDAKSYLAEISFASHHMSDLIDGLLVLSRSTRGGLECDWIDLSDLAETIRKDLAATDPGRKVEWTVERGIGVWGDRRMIELVLRNLLENAWKYTGRTVDPAIHVATEPRGRGRLVRVSDNGAGFDERHADKLFKPFQRLHRQDEFPGIGVGLSTVRRILERHGGTIQAQGAVGKGASFCFFLPEPGEAERDHADQE